MADGGSGPLGYARNGLGTPVPNDPLPPGTPEVATPEHDGVSTGYRLQEHAVGTNGQVSFSISLAAHGDNTNGRKPRTHWEYNAQAFNLEMHDNTTNITSPRPALQIEVGTKNKMEIVVVGGAVTITDPQWTFPAKYLRDWENDVVSDPPHAAEVEIPAAELANTTVDKLFWVSGGNKSIQFTGKINGAPFTLTGNVNAIRPTVAFSVSSTGTIKLDKDPAYGFDPDTTILHYGNGDGMATDTGITYTINPNLNAQGSHVLTIAQLFSSSTTTVWDANNVPASWTGTSGVDAPLPKEVFDAWYKDSPSLALKPSDRKGLISHSFDGWLMYNPPNAGVQYEDWIYVPLKKVSWSWSATAERRGTDWVATSTVSTANAPTDLTSAVPTPGATGTDTLVYPAWTARWQYGRWL